MKPSLKWYEVSAILLLLVVTALCLLVLTAGAATILHSWGVATGFANAFCESVPSCF